MPSNYGTAHNIKPCEACGVKYDKFRTGMTFASVRRDIISIGFDKKTGKTKYGRRNGTLGFWHELKKKMWKAHVRACDAASERAA